jgi:hypothetical protein
MLAACSGGGAGQLPSATAMSGASAPMAAQSAAVAKPVAVAADNDRGGGSGDNNGGTTTYTYVTGLQSTLGLVFNLASKGCDATLADAPLLTPTKSLTVTPVGPVLINDCIPTDNLNAPAAATDLYIVMVDTSSKTLDQTAIAGPATLTYGVWSFPFTSKTVSLAAGDSYAFMVAGASSSGSDGKCHHHHDGDGWGHDGWGWDHWGHGHCDHGWGDGGHHDGDDGDCCNDDNGGHDGGNGHW